MSLEAAHNLSVPDLTRVLSGKIGLRCSRLQDTPLPATFPASSLKSEVDSLEATAQGVLRLAASLRNHSQPINRLPPEILSRIARCLIEDDDEDAISIVSSTHVCRYWRESIISFPGNWSLISSQNEHMAAVSLERAKATPLKITLSMHLVTEYDSFSGIFISYLQNTRTLTVYSLATIEDLTDMLPNFPGSMPALRSLTLDSEGPDWDSSIDPFETFIPALNQLSLANVPLYPSLLNLRTLVELTIRDRHRFDLSLGTLLDFLEQNRSLESVTLGIRFARPSLRNSRRRNPMRSRLRSLLVEGRDVMGTLALISGIPLQSGAHLGINLEDEAARLNDILPTLSARHFSNLSSPTFLKIERNSDITNILLRGTSGMFTLGTFSHSADSFADFAELPLANVREVHFSDSVFDSDPLVFRPSFFPALETLAVKCEEDPLYVLSALLDNPSSSPSLKTLAFLNCDLTDEFIAELTEFASERRSIPSLTGWLDRVLIIHRDGMFPSPSSIRKLKEYVKVIDFRMEDDFPTDLS